MINKPVKKIMLVQAPWSRKGFYGVRAGSRWPHFEMEESRYMPFPFFMAYAASRLQSEGFTVRVLDSLAEKLSIKEFLKKISDFNPDLLFVEISSLSLKADLKAINAACSVGDFVVALGGLHINSSDGDLSLTPEQVKYFLKGEYETSLSELAAALRDGKTTSEVKGLDIKENNRFIQGPSREPESDIDSLPWPARELFPLHSYHDCPGGIPEPSLQMWGSRGCPFGCVFCAWPQIMYGSRSYRARKPSEIVKEASYCVQRWNFKSVYFDDDTFNIGRDRMMEFCREWRKNGPDVPWAIMARADLMDKEILLAMKNSGLAAVKYGVESASSMILQRSGKSLDIDKVVNTVKLTRKIGIPYHLTFMFGLPGETVESIKKTVHLACELDPDSLQFSLATPYPGSEFYRSACENNYLRKDIPFSEFDGYSTAAISTEILPAKKLEACLRSANKIWQNHLRKRNRLNKLKKIPLAGPLIKVLQRF